jgi:hypothetical protein
MQPRRSRSCGPFADDGDVLSPTFYDARSPPTTLEVAMTADRVLGLVFVALGAALFVVLTTGLGGEVFVALVGLGFLVAYVATRLYGLLIPGGILTGLGVGIVVAAQGGPGEAVVLGLGTGFLAIAVVDQIVAGSRPGWWWPLIPGGVLTLVGASGIQALQGAARFALPVLLVVIGILLLVRRPARAAAAPPIETEHEPTAGAAG